MLELIEKLERNAQFYENEAKALAEAPERRDRRHLGAREAAGIASFLREAIAALRNTPPETQKG